MVALSTAVDVQPLTMLEQAFVDAYVGAAYGNATKAVFMAGYDTDKPKNAASMGSRLLAKVNVQRAISLRVSEFAMTREETLAHLTSIGRGDTSGALKALASGDSTKLADLDPTLIESVRVQEGALPSLHIQLQSRLEALKIIARLHNIGTTQHVEVTGAGGGPMLIKQVQQPAITTLATVDSTARQLTSGTDSE